MSSREDLLEIIPQNADPEIRWMMDYWMSKRGERLMPLRSDIDPLDFYKFWPTTYLVEGETLEELYVKVAGTAYRSLYGYEVTGRRIVDLIPGRLAPQIIDDYIDCLENKVPVYSEESMAWRERNAPVFYHRLLLPFGRKAQEVAYILGFAVVFTLSNNKKIVF